MKSLNNINMWFVLLAISNLCYADWVSNGADVSTTTGKVGVGTVSPAEKLHVANGGIRVDTNNEIGLRLYTGDGDSNGLAPGIRFQGSCVENYAGGMEITSPQEEGYGRRGFAVSTHSDASDAQNMIERFRVTYDGKVGIGISNPSAKLSLGGGVQDKILFYESGAVKTGVCQDPFGLSRTTMIFGTDNRIDPSASLVFGFNDENNGSKVERMRITGDGKVGIGTVSPAEKLHVANGGIRVDTNNEIGLRLYTGDGDSNGLAPGIRFQGSCVENYAGGMEITSPQEEGYGRRGFAVSTHSDASDAQNMIERFRVTYDGKVGIGTANPGATLTIDAPTNTSIPLIRIGQSGEYGSGTVLSVAPGIVNFDAPGVSGGRFKIDAAGSVGIGVTSIPADTKLAVNGTIRAKEVIVTQEGWPDYVFSPDYQLPPLSEVESHIKTHQHLADVPSQEQVKTAGVGIGELSNTLLKKIEELTLYTIDQEKRIQEQDLCIKELLSRFNKLDRETH